MEDFNNRIVIVVDCEVSQIENKLHSFIEANHDAIMARGLRVRFDVPIAEHMLACLDTYDGRVVYDYEYTNLGPLDSDAPRTAFVYELSNMATAPDVKIVGETPKPGRNWERWNQAPRSPRRQG